MDEKFTKRYESFRNSLASLTEAKQRDMEDSFVLSGTSAKFSITFDLGWKVMKDILVQYCDLQQEAKDIRKRIEKTQARLNKIQRGGTVLDSVSGTRADGTIGSIRIEGFPFGDFNKQWEHLNRYAESLSAAEAKLLEQAAEVEQYIRTIEDSRMRRIIQYRVIDGLSWYEVADRIGGKATSESCRKYFERFLGKC